MQHLPRKLISFGFILLTAGCSTTVEQEKLELNFPPPPEETRYSFERTIFSSADIEEFTSADRFKAFATGSAKQATFMSKPYGISARNGKVYVTDTATRSIMLFDIPAKKFTVFGNQGNGAVRMPIGIDAASNGMVYVADSSGKRIVIYDADGTYINAIGGPTLLDKPTDVKFNSSNNRLYVVDSGGISSENHRIQVFDTASGEHIKTIGSRGTEKGEFNIPVTMDIDKEGNLYVVDSGNFRVQKFNADGEFLSAYGSVGRRLGQFARPKGIAVDDKLNTYVVDAAFGNFQIFNSEGNLLMFIGSRSQLNMPAKYMLPAGIDVDEKGNIYIIDQFFRKIDVYKRHQTTNEEPTTTKQQNKASD